MKKLLPQPRTRFLLSSTLTMGSTIAWTILIMCLLGGYSLLTGGGYQNSTGEMIQVLSDGTVLIRNWDNTGVNRYRTLEGEDVTEEVNKRNEATTSSRLTTFLTTSDINLKPRVYKRSFSSKNPAKIVSFKDEQQPVRFWYFVVDNHDYGYFEVFNSHTRERLFFVGTQGATSTLPSREEQFPLFSAMDQLGAISLIAPNLTEWPGTQFMSIPAIRGGTGNYNTASLLPEITLLTRDNRIWTIDLTTGAASQRTDQTDIYDLRLLQSLQPRGSDDTPLSYVAIGLQDKIVLNRGDTQILLHIPEPLQGENLSFTLLPEEQVLYSITRREKASETAPILLTDLYWVTRAGEVLQEKQEVLTKPLELPIRDDFRYATMLFPNLFGYQMAIEMTRLNIQQTYELSAGQAWRLILSRTADFLVAAVVLTLISGVVYWLSARRRGVTIHGWQWLLLLVFGPFALIAFWTQWPPIGNAADLEHPPSGLEVITLPVLVGQN